jgi:hypothetical protein
LFLARDAHKVADRSSSPSRFPSSLVINRITRQRRFVLAFLSLLWLPCASAAGPAHVDITWMSIANLHIEAGPVKAVFDGYITRLPQSAFHGGGGGYRREKLVVAVLGVLDVLMVPSFGFLAPACVDRAAPAEHAPTRHSRSNPVRKVVRATCKRPTSPVTCLRATRRSESRHAVLSPHSRRPLRLALSSREWQMRFKCFNNLLERSRAMQ